MKALDNAVSRFGSISLDDLISAAALQTRIDRKYLVPQIDVARLLEHVPSSTLALDADGQRRFTYDSVYFDTIDRVSYLRTAQGRRRRFKLRTRVYVDTSTAFLELKTKSGRGETVKQRIPYDPAAIMQITEYGREHVLADFGPLGLTEADLDRLAPTLGTEYQRTTLLNPEGSRATIDTALEWRDPDGRALKLPGWAIVETKSSSAPSALDRALWRAGQRPQRISKFGTGIAALHPELPTNKWTRLLHGPFAAAEAVSAGEVPRRSRSRHSSDSPASHYAMSGPENRHEDAASHATVMCEGK